MPRKGLTVQKVREVLRLIGLGQTDRQIARSLSMRRSRVAEIRRTGERAPDLLVPKAEETEPEWSRELVWAEIVEDLKNGYEIKRIWEDKVQGRTSYANFWKYLERRYPPLLRDTVTLREFEPGGHCEVDYAGDAIVWHDETGQKHKAHLFVGILCYSQLIFLWATSDQKTPNWLLAHEKMYRYYDGVPRVTVPDNPKTGTIKAHRYDPDLNREYTELAVHFGTAVVPARVRRPRDKSLVENAVGIVERYLRWRFRNRRFGSLSEINAAISEVRDFLNARTHTRFGVSRRDYYERRERAALKPLPTTPFELTLWKTATVHPDSTIGTDGAYYSVPHIHRGKEVQVRLTTHQVEIFCDEERVALHPRSHEHAGRRIIVLGHFPPQSIAYWEATPQNLLSQARGLSPALGDLVDRLLKEDSLGQLRRVQGLVRVARNVRTALGGDKAGPLLEEAVSWMRQFSQVRVQRFQAILSQLQSAAPSPPDRTPTRLPGNPMLRESSVSPEEVSP